MVNWNFVSVAVTWFDFRFQIPPTDQWLLQFIPLHQNSLTTTTIHKQRANTEDLKVKAGSNLTRMPQETSCRSSPGRKWSYLEAPKGSQDDQSQNSGDNSGEQPDSSGSNQDIVAQGPNKRKYSGPQVMPSGQLDSHSGSSHAKGQKMSSWDVGNDDFPQSDDHQQQQQNGDDQPPPVRKPPPPRRSQEQRLNMAANPAPSSSARGSPPPWATAMLKRKYPQGMEQPQQSQASTVDDSDDKPFLANSQQGKYRPMSNHESSSFKSPGTMFRIVFGTLDRYSICPFATVFVIHFSNAR